MKRTLLAIIATLSIVFGVVSAQPASAATSGVIEWQANYHGIDMWGRWDNWAGNARCALSLTVGQYGAGGPAYLESWNFGYGYGGCTGTNGSGSGTDPYNWGGVNKYRVRLDYRYWWGGDYSAYGVWIGDVGGISDGMTGITQYLALMGPSGSIAVRACVEAWNYHIGQDGGTSGWEQTHYYDNECIYA